MQKKTIRILQALAFILVLALSVGGAYRALKWKDTSGDYISTVDQLYATDKNLIDVVFMGSSHTYCGIYPAVLWDDAGIASFDMAISGQDKNSTYYALLELLKTQKPKVVMVDCYGLLFDKHQIESNEYRNYLSMKYSTNTIKHVNSYVEEDKRADYLTRFPIIHTRYKELKKKDFVEYAPNKFGRGGFYSWHSEPMSFDEEAIASKEVGQMSDSNKKWIDDLQALSEKYDFELEFMLIPSYVNKDYQTIINTCKNYFDEKSIPFTDFNQMKKELGINDATDFVDTSHLNAFGATKLTRYIEDKLIEEYNIESHAGDPDYYQWDQDLVWMETLKSKAIMEAAPTAQDYLTAVLSTPDLTTVISLEGDLVNETSYFPALQALGMTLEEYQAGGKWIYRSGKLEKIHDNIEGQEDFLLTLGKYDTLKVGYYGLCQESNLMLNRENYQTGCNLTFITYSHMLEEVIGYRGY